MTILTTAQVAARLGINPSRVRQLAIEHNVGTKINDRTRIFTEEEVAMIGEARSPIGRPRINSARLVSDLADADPEPPVALAEIARKIAWGAVATDQILTTTQTVAIPRAWYDQLTAALASAAADDPLAVATRDLLATADVDESDVDFPPAAFARFDAAAR